MVDSYSLGRIHRIALLDKEWCLGETRGKIDAFLMLLERKLRVKLGARRLIFLEKASKATKLEVFEPLPCL